MYPVMKGGIIQTDVFFLQKSMCVYKYIYIILNLEGLPSIRFNNHPQKCTQFDSSH